MDKRIGIVLGIFFALLFVPSVMASVVVPTCTFGGHTPSDDSVTDNTTLHVTITALTGYNMSNATIVITPHNGTSGGVFMDNKTAPDYTAIWTSLPDTTYTITARFELLNNSNDNHFVNFSAMSVSCTPREFSIDTTEGVAPIVQDTIVTQTTGGQKGLGVVLVILIAYVGYTLISKKK